MSKRVTLEDALEFVKEKQINRGLDCNYNFEETISRVEGDVYLSTLEGESQSKFNEVVNHLIDIGMTVDTNFSIEKQKQSDIMSACSLCAWLTGLYTFESLSAMNDNNVVRFFSPKPVGKPYTGDAKKSFYIYEDAFGTMSLVTMMTDKEHIFPFDTIYELNNLLIWEGLLEKETHSNMTKNILTFLGDGSAFNSKSFNNAPFFNPTPEHHVQIDLGGTAINPFIDYIDANPQITRVSFLITHMHLDHVGGLTTALLYLFFKKGIKADVYVPSRISDDMVKFLEMTGGVYGMCTLHSDEYVYNLVDGVNVRYTPTQHAEIFSFAIYITLEDERKYYYSGDSKLLPDSVIQEVNSGEFTHVYIDAEPDGYSNVHIQYGVLLDSFDREVRQNITIMHLVDESFRKRIQEDGFNKPILLK